MSLKVTVSEEYKDYKVSYPQLMIVSDKLDELDNGSIFIAHGPNKYNGNIRATVLVATDKESDTQAGEYCDNYVYPHCVKPFNGKLTISNDD